MSYLIIYHRKFLFCYACVIVALLWTIIWVYYVKMASWTKRFLRLLYSTVLRYRQFRQMHSFLGKKGCVQSIRSISRYHFFQCYCALLNRAHVVVLIVIAACNIHKTLINKIKEFANFGLLRCKILSLYFLVSRSRFHVVIM